MDCSYLFRAAKCVPALLADCGFTESSPQNAGAPSDGAPAYTLRKNISGGDFYVLFRLNPAAETLSAQVYDAATDEKYALFDMNRAHGSFVAAMRKEVQEILADIRRTCFVSVDQKDRYIAFLKAHFGCGPDFPWQDTPDFCVFRRENQKWFALIMRITYKQLGLQGDEDVWVVNLKADADSIGALIDKKSVFPAWHMNKKHWITVLLTAATDFDRLCALTERSYALVQGAERKA